MRQAEAALDLAELERRPIRVRLSPAPSLFALVADAAGAGRGAPPRWLDRIRAELDRGDLAALLPLAAPPGVSIPASVMPSPRSSPADLATELDRIAELPAQALLDDIAFACGGEPAGPWAAVARRPRSWLPRYARALGRAWRAVRGPWSSAAQLFDRELERVAVASAHGALAELLGGLHPRARVAGGRWILPDPVLRSLRLSDRGLTLYPILGGAESAAAGIDERGTLEWIAHPVADSWRGGALVAAARLEALVGEQRARLLRTLAQPRSVGRLAEALIAVPSAATHHVDALEAAGLVVRERRGRSVIVHRTDRGTRLVGLYGES